VDGPSPKLDQHEPSHSHAREHTRTDGRSRDAAEMAADVDGGCGGVNRHCGGVPVTPMRPSHGEELTAAMADGCSGKWSCG